MNAFGLVFQNNVKADKLSCHSIIHQYMQQFNVKYILLIYDCTNELTLQYTPYGHLIPCVVQCHLNVYLYLKYPCLSKIECGYCMCTYSAIPYTTHD